MDSGAHLVRYGGTTITSADGLCPQMGSGRLPSNDYTRVGFFAQTKIVNSDFVSVDLDQGILRKNVDSPTSCYDLKHFGNQGAGLLDTFSFGGPGGAFCDVWLQIYNFVQIWMFLLQQLILNYLSNYSLINHLNNVNFNITVV